MTGFELRKLVLSGAGVEDAEVIFRRGLNVVVGPSDTGKSYIYRCLDFMLGGTTPPKEIPQDAGYSTIALTIASSEGDEYELRRGLRGGDFRLSEASGEDRTLRPKHSAKRDNISTFLLQLLGMAGKRVRKNANGTTRSLSFRDLAHLAFVDEVAIMVERSPALTGQNMSVIEENRVFHLLLSGEDDAAVIAAEKQEVFRAKSKGRAEILETLIQGARSGRVERGVASDLKTAEERLALSEAAADTAGDELASEEEVAGAVEVRRRAAWSELRVRQSRADVLRQLETRLVLLEQQYNADLERLEAISEVGLRVEQMPVERCSVCGAEPEHQDHEHASEGPTVEEVRESCEAEREKIANLLSDLQETASRNVEELALLDGEIIDRGAGLDVLEAELNETLRPKVAAASEAFRAAQTAVRADAEDVRVLRYESELEELLEQQPKKPDQPSFGAAGATAGQAADFAAAVEKLLREWHFPEVARVSFSEEAQDIVIGGRARRSYGQGKLALTHAAFTLGLLRSCIDVGRPAIPLVMIDSPLVVYREPKSDESVPEGVKDHFYRSLARSFEDTQVVIFENEVPPRDVINSSNVVVFSGTDEGRHGFLHHDDIGRA